jgi:hypothetical protein
MFRYFVTRGRQTQEKAAKHAIKRKTCTHCGKTKQAESFQPIAVVVTG